MNIKQQAHILNNKYTIRTPFHTPTYPTVASLLSRSRGIDNKLSIGASCHSLTNNETLSRKQQGMPRFISAKPSRAMWPQVGVAKLGKMKKKKP